MVNNKKNDKQLLNKHQEFFDLLKSKLNFISINKIKELNVIDNKNNNTIKLRDYKPVDNDFFSNLTFDSLIIKKRDLQFDIDNLKSKISKLTKSVKISFSKDSLSKIITQEELIEIKKLKCLIKDIEYLKIKNKLLKTLTKIINKLLNGFKNILINLKNSYTKQHSFHFKNLDDYHSLNLNLTNF